MKHTRGHSLASGQTLIEVLIITVLVASILTAIAGVVAKSLQNTAETRRQALATDLAQQGLETFRGQRRSLGWESFQTSLVDATYCLNDLPSSTEAFVAMAEGTCGDETVAGTEFTREAVVDSADEQVEVVINVTWNADAIETVSVRQVFRDTENEN